MKKKYVSPLFAELGLELEAVLYESDLDNEYDDGKDDFDSDKYDKEDDFITP